MRSICFIVVILSASLVTFGQPVGVEMLQKTGPSSNRVDMVILGDGYTEDEQDKLQSDAIALTNDVFATEIFEKFWAYFNIHLIKVISNESGATHQGIAVDEPDSASHPIKQVDNYFGSAFDFGGFHRLMSISKNLELQMALANNVPDYDVVVIMVNSDYYGGGSGAYTIVTRHPQSSEILLHELGHTLAGLADEYEEPGGTPTERQNVTRETDPGLIRWKKWIQEGIQIPTPEIPANGDKIGLFEGAAYNPTGWYRPKMDCKMNHLDVPFCEICNEAILTNIYRFVNPITDWNPKVKTYTVTGNVTVNFSIELLRPYYQIDWTLNGCDVDVHSNSLRIDFGNATSKENIIRATVTDSTRLYRGEPIQFDTAWTIIGNVRQIYYPPEIQSFAPMTGKYGDEVTIKTRRTNNALPDDLVRVTINDEPMELVAISPDSVTFRVPMEAMKGYVQLHYGEQYQTSTQLFQTKPDIVSIDPMNGHGGDMVSIKGTNFSEKGDENLVFFGVNSAKIMESSPSLLRVQVPEITEPSFIEVGYNGLKDISGEQFQLKLISGLASKVKSSVYPNPTTGLVSILMPKEFSSQYNTVELYDLNGIRHHKSIREGGSFDLDLKDLPAGYYILVCKNDEYYYKTRLVISR